MKRTRFGVLLWSATTMVMGACHGRGTDGQPADASSVDLPPIRSGVAAVQVAVNGSFSGTVQEPCPRGLFLSTAVNNLSSQPLVVRQLFVDFETLAGSCTNHRAPIDPGLNTVVAPGTTAWVRVFNAAGTLCEPPTGQVGCSWRATARVATDAGLATGTLDFSGQSITPRTGCNASIVPRILRPQAGETVSGVVPVEASVAEGAGCNISARSIVWAYSEGNVVVGHSLPIDLGDRWRWDTTRLPNGRYFLRTEQNCCRILSGSVEVNVRN